jgi:hypothetical protein
MVAECTAPESEGGRAITAKELRDNERAIRDLALVAAELNAALDKAIGLRVVA